MNDVYSAFANAYTSGGNSTNKPSLFDSNDLENNKSVISSDTMVSLS
jgi:hypothetical protein